MTGTLERRSPRSFERMTNGPRQHPPTSSVEPAIEERHVKARLPHGSHVATLSELKVVAQLTGTVTVVTTPLGRFTVMVAVPCANAVRIIAATLPSAVRALLATVMMPGGLIAMATPLVQEVVSWRASLVPGKIPPAGTVPSPPVAAMSKIAATLSDSVCPQ